jgi:PhzF family phenazine biosynthesis protein
VTPLFHVDAFTATPYSGNPAAVVLLDARPDSPADPAWMQAVAAELRLSETAFVASRPDGDLDLRWFTPTVEVDLCGHATLASAHVLFETARLDPQEPARFHTRSGPLSARRAGGRIVLDFPAQPVRPTPAVELTGLAALGAPEPVGTFDNGSAFVVELADEQAVLATRPRERELGAAADRVWVVTAPAAPDRDADFVSRCFAPRYGIDEDPVTGSAHCALGPFWSERVGRADLVGHQVSARGGTVRVGVRGDRVELGGEAVTVARGELLG